MNATMNDVRLWALANDDDKDALYELLKVPARLGLHDSDLGLVPADLRYFENIVAPSSYAPVSKAADLDGARRRGTGGSGLCFGAFTGRFPCPEGRAATVPTGTPSSTM